MVLPIFSSSLPSRENVAFSRDEEKTLAIGFLIFFNCLLIELVECLKRNDLLFFELESLISFKQSKSMFAHEGDII